MSIKEFVKSPVDSLVFYTETLRLIKFYLNSLSCDTPSLALSLFLSSRDELHNVKSNIKNRTIEFSKIDNEMELGNEIQCNNKEIELNYNKEIEINWNNEITTEHNEKAVVFLEELRILTLASMPSANISSKRELQKYHLYLHLFQLSLQTEKTKFEKMHEFLELNFCLVENDIIGHACRGNYGKIIEIDISLESAIEEIHLLDKNNKEMINKWKTRHSVTETISRILTGKYKNFDNRYEELCYSLLHNIPCDFSDGLTDMLIGKYNGMEYENTPWLNLIFLITVGSGTLRDCEKCFEKLFFETFNLDFMTGLDFLSFSRKCIFYFPYLLDLIPLNPLTVENLIRFSNKNNLNKENIINNFGHYLQNENEYEQLCRFILNHNVKNFKYTRSFMAYFIEHFNQFRSFYREDIKNDDAIDFIHKMNNLDVVDEESLCSLIGSKYFLWFCDEITLSLHGRDNLSDQIILRAMNTVFEIEKKTGQSLNQLKSTLAKKLI